MKTFLRKNLFIILAIGVFFTSCKSEKQKNKELVDLITYYMQVSGEMGEKGADPQEFINLFTKEILTLQAEPNAELSVDSLSKIHQEVLASCNVRIKKLNRMRDFDDDFNLKANTLHYCELLASVLNNEMKLAIEILKSTDLDRFDRITEMLYPRLQSLKVAIDNVKEADHRFKSNYHIK